MILPPALNNAMAPAVPTVDDQEWDKVHEDHQLPGSTGLSLEQARVAALNAMALSA